ncbi:MAG: tetratricopeptide repeat protein [Candidatus Hydrogenedentota bacterium]|nr:MAG: tetratricopeptide repeat protein [Candidatus Hydrogenedentota bacterium]
MRKLGFSISVIAMVWITGCSSNKGLRVPRISDINVVGSSKNQRTYQADYNTTFRAAVDALRQIDDNSAKLVKHGSGLIIFKKPDNAGIITANVKKMDEHTTRVELVAKNTRKFWLDDNDEETRESFFAELDKLLGATSSEAPEADARHARQSTLTKTRAAPGKEAEENRRLLIAKLVQELQLSEKDHFLDKLSYEELSMLDQRLQALISVSSENKDLTRKCAGCYIDLARAYHDNGQYSRSAEALKIAIAVDPGNAVAHCNLGEVYKHLRLFDDAIRELGEAKRLNPDLPDTYINLGIIYDDYVVDDQKALECYSKYLELGGTDRQVLEWISTIEEGS